MHYFLSSPPKWRLPGQILSHTATSIGLSSALWYPGYEPLCHTLEPSWLLWTAWPYPLFIEDIGKGPIVFFFMSNSANNLPHLVYPWGMLDLSVLDSISDYLLHSVSITQSHGRHQALSSKNHSTSQPVTFCSSSTSHWVIFYFVDFPNLSKLLLSFFFLLFYYPFAVSFSFSTQEGFHASWLLPLTCVLHLFYF